MKTFFSVIMAVLCCGQVIAQKCDVDSGFRGNRFSIYYEQRHLVKTIREIDELPANVRKQLYVYLNEKLGVDFAKRLKLDWGEYLNLNQLKNEFPSLYEENLKLGAYDLVFFFSDKSNGLKSYYSKIALNEDGSINEEIKLPDIGSEPSKGEIISCKKAILIANKNGFPKKFQSISFEYSPERKGFIWLITDSRETQPDVSENDFLYGLNGKGTYRRIEINANSGEVLRIYKYTIIL